MTIRFILVGLGVRGQQWARVVHEAPDATGVAYVDLSLDSARQTAAQYDNARPCLTDLTEALQTVPADAVIVATPPAAHYAQTLAAFEAGCDVLCEKPLVETLAEAVDLVGQARASGRRLLVGMNFRHLPASQAIRQAIAETRFGPPSYAHFTYHRHRDGRRTDLNDFPMTMRHPMLLEQSIHHLDLLRYCYQAEVEALAAHTWRPSWSTYAGDCCVSTLLHFNNGLRATYFGTWTAAWNRFVFEWRTECASGTILQRAQSGDLATVTFEPELALAGQRFKEAEEAEPLRPVSLPATREFVDDTRGLLNEYLATVKADRPLLSSGQDHLKTLALVLACCQAAETRQWVDMAAFYKQQAIPEEWL